MAEAFLIIVGIILLILGFIGSVVPIPGVPIAWISLLLLYFVEDANMSIQILIINALIALIVTIIDTLAPVMLTKKVGGTKSGIIGSVVGIIVGMFFGLPGIIICPFVGALVGELFHNHKNVKNAFKSALGSFLGFLLGVGLKLMACTIFTYFFAKSLFRL